MSEWVFGGPMSDWVEWRLTVGELQAALAGRQEGAVVLFEAPPNADGIKILYNVDIAPEQSLGSVVFKLITREPPEDIFGMYRTGARLSSGEDEP